MQTIPLVEMIQELLLNCDYHKQELAIELHINLEQINFILTGKLRKGKMKVLLIKLLAISRRHTLKNKKIHWVMKPDERMI